MRSAPVIAVLSVLPLFAAGSIYDFSLKTIDGGDLPLAAFRGKAMMVVNTASQ